MAQLWTLASCRTLVWTAATIVFTAACSPAQYRAGERYEGNATAIQNVTIVDVSNGTTVAGQTVVIRYGKIAYVKPASDFDSPGWMTVLDGSGRFLIPGLWDAHVHLSFWDEPDGEATQSKAVDNDYGEVLGILSSWGITSVRDMGGDLEALDVWRKALAEGQATGPTIYRAGPYVDGPKPNDKFRRFVTSPSEARKLVRELSGRGVDFLKIHSRVPPEVLPDLAEEAARLGLPVGGHVPYGTSIEDLLDWGIATVEHVDAPFISRLGSREGSYEDWKAAYDWHRSDEGDALFARMKEEGVWFTPTLAVFDSGWEGVPEPWDALRAWYRDLAGLAHSKGVRLLAGTDVARRTGPVSPGIGLHEELEHLVAIGLEPWEALRAATLYPAMALGRSDETGSIQPGMIADLVLLAGNPLTDIRRTREIEAVILRGRLLDELQLPKP